MKVIQFFTVVAGLLLSSSYSEAAEASFSPDVLAVCPGVTATFECTVVAAMDPLTIIWTTNTTADQCELNLSNTSAMCGRFFAQLGTPDGDCFPSNLTVENVTEGLDNTLVDCSGPNGTVGGGTLNVYMNQQEAPDSPESISFTPTYGVLDVTATTVEWSYPEDGAEVNEYTVTVTDDDAIVQVQTTNDTQVSLSSLPYDTMLTLNITATNCIGTSTAAFANFSEVNCMPVNVSYTPTYGVLDVTAVTVEWNYPEDRPVVTEYNVTVIHAMTRAFVVYQTTNETQVSFANFPYNTPYAVSVTTNGCAGSNTVTISYYEAGCVTPPIPPENGVILPITSSQPGTITLYGCNVGYFPVGERYRPLACQPAPVAVGVDWLPAFPTDPIPSELNCTLQASESSQPSLAGILSGVIIGSILLLIAEAGGFIYCLIRTRNQELKEVSSL